MLKKIGFSASALVLASSAQAQQIGAVFYISLENHNWTQPSSIRSPPPIFGNLAAPFINSLVTPGAPTATMVSYASDYQNVSSTLHPSEPNYVWQEAGVHGPLNDDDPYPNNIVAAPHLSALSATNGQSWRSYQEDIDLLNTSGQNFNSNHGAGSVLTNNVSARSRYEVPLTSFSGTSVYYTNAYNGSHQYDYAAKHNPQLFFTDTNGGNDSSAKNSQAQNYAPLQQLSSDLANNTVARYNWITPNQYNDMHTALTGGFTYHGVHYTGDEAQIAQGDNFLSQIVPKIEASQAFKNNGEIVIWTDETEGDKKAGSMAGFTLMEIVISRLAKGSAYTNNIRYTHSSDLRTLECIFGVAAPGGGYLGGAAEAISLADLYQGGVIPVAIPESQPRR